MNKHAARYHDGENTASIPNSLSRSSDHSQQDRSLFRLKAPSTVTNKQLSTNTGEQSGLQPASSALRVKKLMNEVAYELDTSSTGFFEPAVVPMSKDTRREMVEKLGKVGNIVVDMEESLPQFLERSKSDDATRDLLRTVCSV